MFLSCTLLVIFQHPTLEKLSQALSPCFEVLIIYPQCEICLRPSSVFLCLHHTPPPIAAFASCRVSWLCLAESPSSISFPSPRKKQDFAQGEWVLPGSCGCVRARSRSLSPSGSRASRSLADSCARSLSSQEELRREALKQRAEHSVHSEDPGWEEEEEGKGAISSGCSLTGPAPFGTPAGRPLSSLPARSSAPFFDLQRSHNDPTELCDWNLATAIYLC